MNPAQGQQPGQQGQQGAQSPSQAGAQQNLNPGNPQQPHLYQPSQIRALTILSDEEKNKYVQGLEGLWAKIKTSPNGSVEYKQATEKIWNFSKMLTNKVAQRQATIRQHQMGMQQQQGQQAQQAQQGQQPPQQAPQQRPQTQNQQQTQQPQQQATGQAQQPQPPRQQTVGQNPQAPNQGQQQAAQNGAAANQNQARGVPPQANNQPPKMPENIMNHLRQVKLKPGPEHEGKPAAEQATQMNELRTRYGRALMSAESAKSRIRAIDNMIAKRSQDGNPFSEEDLKKLEGQKAAQQKAHGDAARWIEHFRKTHVASGPANNTQNGTVQNTQGGNASVAPQPAQQGAAAAVNRPSPPNGQAPNQNAAAQQAQAQIQAQQRPQLADNTQQNQQAGGRPQLGRGQAPNAQPGQATNPPGPGRGLSVQEANTMANQKAAANTAQAQQANGQQQAASTPTSAGAAPAQQPPQQQQQQGQQPQQAQSQQTPIQQQAQAQQGHPHAHPTQGQPTMHSKMPIPKTLPDKAVSVPQGVAPGGGIKGNRPTMNQGTSTMGAQMHQPAIQKIPGYNNEAEGDHVLSKKKLDELVRQVCGGSSDGQEGNLLTPEVEENVLNMADSFVDNVLHAACRNSKERGSKTLEIRDIQLILERTYNIRVPGYSSDELRTVRKVQPTTGWIAKMSAVQAAKVMPGKEG